MKRVVALLIALMILTLLTGCGAEMNEDDETLLSNIETNAQTPIIIYEDEILVASYLGLSDVAGQIGMSFILENKSDEEIMVLPLNSSVNDVMVQFVSGMPAIIQPGKTFSQIWMANPQVVGVSDSSEVKEIEFTLNFGDSETEIITINP